MKKQQLKCVKQIFGRKQYETQYNILSNCNKMIIKSHVTTRILNNNNYKLPIITKHLLPANFPRSVSINYLSYTKWQMIAATTSASIGVLSTQSLLLAMGMGASTSISAAVALNWIIKDGLGQLGGVLYASWVSNKFDADPRRWRMIAAYALDFSCLVEILTPLVPHLFLLIASVANISKNVAWLSASATRAGINRSFSITDNLADVTAKSGSQTITASTLGMGIGVTLCWFIEATTTNMLSIFAGLSFIHLWSLYRSLKFVALASLNLQRAEILAIEYIKQSSNHEKIQLSTPNEVRLKDNFILKYESELTVDHIIDGVVDKCFTSTQLMDAIQICENEKFIIRVDEKNRKVYSLMLENATYLDVLSCFLICTKLRLDLTQNNYHEKSLYESLEWLQIHRNTFAHNLEISQWQIDNLMFDTNNVRLKFIN